MLIIWSRTAAVGASLELNAKRNLKFLKLKLKTLLLIKIITVDLHDRQQLGYLPKWIWSTRLWSPGDLQGLFRHCHHWIWVRADDRMSYY